MQLSLNDFLSPTERLPELIDHRKPKNLKAERWALAKPLLQAAPVVTENPAEFERVIKSVLDTLALNQKQAHERMIGHTVTWITGATLPKPKHHKGKILAVLVPGAKREEWIHLLPPEFDEMGKLVKGMEDARQVGKERSKELKALRAEWKRLYKAVKVNSRNGGYLVAEETEEGVVYRCIAPNLVHKQAESQTLLQQEGLAETAPVPLPIEPQDISEKSLEFQKAENLDPVCSEQTPEQPNSTPVSSPSVNSAPEPAAKVILGKPLGRSHPGLGINKPVCFYCKGQEELEYAGLFPNAIKSMNHHIWRCKKQPRHQLVCAEKGDWWYQWCGGVGYGVTYGVPEPWMWKDIFQSATGQEPETNFEQPVVGNLTLGPETGLIKCEPQKSDSPLPRRAGKGKVHLVKPGDERALCHFRPGYSSGGWTDSDVQPNCPRCIKENETLTPAPEKDVQELELEAAELRAKLQNVKTIRAKQKQVEELKNTRAQISKKISEIMGRGHSRLNDEEAAHFQKKYDRASQAIRALEEEIPGIIPATWRWEERLAEIEQALGLSKGGQA